MSEPAAKKMKLDDAPPPPPPPPFFPPPRPRPPPPPNVTCSTPTTISYVNAIIATSPTINTAAVGGSDSPILRARIGDVSAAGVAATRATAATLNPVVIPRTYRFYMTPEQLRDYNERMKQAVGSLFQLASVSSGHDAGLLFGLLYNYTIWNKTFMEKLANSTCETGDIENGKLLIAQLNHTCATMCNNLARAARDNN